VFVTTPSLEQWVPKELGPPDARYWAGFDLATNAPWYLVTHQFQADGDTFVQTTVLALESHLVEFVKGAESEAVISVQCVSRQPGGEWSMQSIAELWLPSEEEAQDTGPLLFFMREGGLFDAHQQEVVGPSANRRLLCRFASPDES